MQNREHPESRSSPWEVGRGMGDPGMQLQDGEGLILPPACRNPTGVPRIREVLRQRSRVCQCI